MKNCKFKEEQERRLRGGEPLLLILVISLLMLSTHSTFEDFATQSCILLKANTDVLAWFLLLQSYAAVCVFEHQETI